MPRTVIVTDSTASIPPSRRRSAGSSSCRSRWSSARRSTTRAATARRPELVAKALADFVPVSTSRPNPAAMAEVYERLAREGAERDPLDPPVGRDERHLRVRAARGRAGHGAGHVHRQPAGRGRDRVRRTVGRRRPRRRRHGGRGGAGGPRPGRRCDVAVLRRHPRIPPPGRPDRCRRGDPRWRAVGQAAAEHRRRQGRQPREGPHRARRRSPASRTSRSRPRASQPVDVYVAHLANTNAPSSWPRSWASGSADNLEGREIWCGELGAVLGAHVGPGMVAVCVAPAPLES